MVYILSGKESENYLYKDKVNNLILIFIPFNFLLYKYWNIKYFGSGKK